MPLTKCKFFSGTRSIVPLNRRDATSASQIPFISALKCILLPGRYCDSTSTKGIFIAKHTASNTHPSDVSDGQNEEKLLTLPPTIGEDIETGELIEMDVTKLDRRLNNETGLEPRLLIFPSRVKPDPVLPLFAPRELSLDLLSWLDEDVG